MKKIVVFLTISFTALSYGAQRSIEERAEEISNQAHHLVLSDITTHGQFMLRQMLSKYDFSEGTDPEMLDHIRADLRNRYIKTYHLEARDESVQILLNKAINNQLEVFFRTHPQFSPLTTPTLSQFFDQRKIIMSGTLVAIGSAYALYHYLRK